MEIGQASDLKGVLKEMGFDEHLFMVVSLDEQIMVSENLLPNDPNACYRLEEQMRYESGAMGQKDYLSFGGYHAHPSDPNGYRDQDKYRFAEGLGSNNGMYTAKLRNDNYMIVTKDPEIYTKLYDKMRLKEDELPVPFTVGKIVNPEKRNQFESMKRSCENKAEYQMSQKRTAAVQRGNIITAYDPTKKDAAGHYTNVAHFERTPNGCFNRVNAVEASARLGYQDNMLSSNNAERMAHDGIAIETGGKAFDFAMARANGGR